MLNFLSGYFKLLLEITSASSFFPFLRVHTVLKRALSVSSLEQLAEIGNILKAKLLCNFVNGEGGMIQKLHSAAHAKFVDVFNGGCGIDGFKNPDEMGGGDVRHFRQIIQVNKILVIVFFDVANRIFDGVVPIQNIVKHQMFRKKIAKNIIKHHFGAEAIAKGLGNPNFFKILKKLKKFFGELKIIKRAERVIQSSAFFQCKYGADIVKFR